jgi:hypothetical protein
LSGQHEDEPPVLLPGPSAWHWMRRLTGCLIGFVPCLAVMFVGSYADPALRQVLILGAIVGIVVLSIVGLHAAWHEFSAERAEKDAGYTTLFGRRYRRYWHLDPKTGAVIRRPLDGG